MERPIRYPESLMLRLPPGTKERLDAASEPTETLAEVGRRAITEWLAQVDTPTDGGEAGE